MDIPTELPTIRAARCPRCAGKIGMHLVKARFRCPHCAGVVGSNVGGAFNEGCAVFALVFVAWLLWRLAVDAALLSPLLSLVFVAGFYAGHAWYRWRLRLAPGG